MTRAMPRLFLMLLLLLCAAPTALEAQGSSDRSRRAAMEARRDSLEHEILQKFVHRVAGEMRLDDVQRAEVARILTESGQRRHELLRASGELRGRMYRALRTGTTSDADFARLMIESRELRDREHAVWDADMQALARVLNPRQRIHFVLSWAHFQDSMREILSRQMRESSTRDEKS